MTPKDANELLTSYALLFMRYMSLFLNKLTLIKRNKKIKE